MKINRDKFSKHLARFGLIIMSFVIMIPMLCSMAFPVTITISNPESLPYEYDSFMVNGDTLGFGSHVIDSPFGYAEITSDSVVINGETYSISLSDIPDGYYQIDLCIISYMDPTSYVSITTENPYSPSAIMDIDHFTLLCLDDGTNFTLAENQYYIEGPITIFTLSPYEPPTPTESITNVWTGIMNWLTSSLNIVQGIFITGGGGTPISSVLDLNDSVTVDGTTLYHISPDYTGDLYYNGTLFDFSAVDFVLGDGYELGYLDGVLMYYAPSPVSESNLYMANLPSFTLTAGQPYQLTLLGTLAVIGLSIALGFLIIGIIQRFLKLRG